MKKIYRNTNLTCIFQNEELKANQSLTGDIFITEDGIRFEEEVKTTKPHSRNPKLFNGKYISLVRKADKTVQFSFKSNALDFDRVHFAENVNNELHIALSKLD